MPRNAPLSAMAVEATGQGDEVAMLLGGDRGRQRILRAGCLVRVPGLCRHALDQTEDSFCHGAQGQPPIISACRIYSKGFFTHECLQRGCQPGYNTRPRGQKGHLSVSRPTGRQQRHSTTTFRPDFRMAVLPPEKRSSFSKSTGATPWKG